ILQQVAHQLQPQLLLPLLKRPAHQPRQQQQQQQQRQLRLLLLVPLLRLPLQPQQQQRQQQLAVVVVVLHRPVRQQQQQLLAVVLHQPLHRLQQQRLLAVLLRQALQPQQQRQQRQQQPHQRALQPQQQRLLAVLLQLALQPQQQRLLAVLLQLALQPQQQRLLAVLLQLALQPQQQRLPVVLLQLALQPQQQRLPVVLLQLALQPQQQRQQRQQKPLALHRLAHQLQPQQRLQCDRVSYYDYESYHLSVMHIITVTTCDSTGLGTLKTLSGAEPSNWTQYQFNYTANNTSPIIMFGFEHDSNRYFFLDSVSIVDQSAPSIQLLKNPDFESSSTQPTDWVLWCTSTCKGSQKVIESGSECYLSTGNCIQDDCNGDNSIDLIAQSFTASIGNTYTVSFWVRSDGSGSIKKNKFFADII
ncbi:unnamed protein product, partial [Rotaria sp. Silwood1]